MLIIKRQAKLLLPIYQKQKMTFRSSSILVYTYIVMYLVSKFVTLRIRIFFKKLMIIQETL